MGTMKKKGQKNKQTPLLPFDPRRTIHTDTQFITPLTLRSFLSVFLFVFTSVSSPFLVYFFTLTYYLLDYKTI